MSKNVSWLLELSIKPDSLRAFDSLRKEMIADVKANEPAAVHYEWYISEDKSICHIYERYSDSAAVMTHLANFGERFAERFFAAVDATRMTVFGEASQEAQNALAQVGATFMNNWDGFVRDH